MYEDQEQEEREEGRRSRCSDVFWRGSAVIELFRCNAEVVETLGIAKNVWGTGARAVL